MSELPRRCWTNKVGAAGECLFCDAEQGESCRTQEAEHARKELRAAEHVLVKCANGHSNWMTREEHDGWRIQTAYCSTCNAPLHQNASTTP